MIYGFDAHVNNIVDILRDVYRLFKRVLRLPIQYDEIVHITKIGRDELHKRPVNVKLKSPELAKQILKKRGSLRGLSLKIEAYVPMEVIKEQKKLLPLIHHYRAKKKFAIIRDGKIIVNNHVVRDLVKEHYDRLRNKTSTQNGGNLAQNQNCTVHVESDNAQF